MKTSPFRAIPRIKGELVKQKNNECHEMRYKRILHLLNDEQFAIDKIIQLNNNQQRPFHLITFHSKRPRCTALFIHLSK